MFHMEAFQNWIWYLSILETVFTLSFSVCGSLHFQLVKRFFFSQFPMGFLNVEKNVRKTENYHFLFARF